jgi:hypothetical protein
VGKKEIRQKKENEHHDAVLSVGGRVPGFAQFGTPRGEIFISLQQHCKKIWKSIPDTRKLSYLTALSEILATPSNLCFLIRKIQTIQKKQFTFVSLWIAS